MRRFHTLATWLPLCILIWVGPVALHAQHNFNLHENVPYINLSPAVEYYIDSSARLILADMFAPQYSVQFKPMLSAIPNFGYTEQVFWLRFKLTNSDRAESSWFIEIGYPLLNHITVYIQRHGQPLETNRFGNFYPFHERRFACSNFVIPIKLQPAEDVTIFLNIQTKGSMELPIYIWQPQAFAWHINHEQFIFGIYYGIMIIIVLFNLFLSFSTGDLSYFLYVAYILFYSLMQLTLSGHAFEYIWPKIPAFNAYATPLFITLGSLYMLFFTKRFLNINKRQKILFAVIQGNIFFSYILILLIFVANYTFAIRLSVISGGIISPFIGIAAGYICRKQGYKPARYYLLAFFFMLLGTVIFALSKLTILPSNNLTMNMSQIGSVIQVVLLSIAISDRINVLKDEKEQSQKQMIAALHEADVIKERHTIELQRMNQELEEKMLSRTAELATKNIELMEKQELLQKAYNELQQIDKLKSDFISSVSHELRTPLTSILGFSKVIYKYIARLTSFIDTRLPDPAMKRYLPRIGKNLTIIISESERLTRLINDVLDLARIESGKMQWHDNSWEGRDIITEAIGICHGFFADKPHLAFITEIYTGNEKLYVDKDRIIQVITNLISNSIKFTEEGYIKLRVICNETALHVEVIDTGIGIDENDMESIFDKFKQSGDTLTSKPRGTGLGLPICREIIQNYGGTIKVQSKRGKGSTFAFDLPLLHKETT